VLTRFPGRGAPDLRAAIVAGTTVAVRGKGSTLVGARTLARSVRRRLTGEAAREVARRERGALR
jgi:hypothetical protein